MARKKILRKDKKCYGTFVWLAISEYEHLCQLLGKDMTDNYIVDLNLYIGSKGDPYESHYFTIMNWNRREKKKSGVQASGSAMTTEAQRLAARVIEAIKDPGNKIMPTFDEKTLKALYAVLRRRMTRWPEVWKQRHDLEFLGEIKKEIEQEFKVSSF